MSEPDYEVQELAARVRERLGPSGENWLQGKLYAQLPTQEVPAVCLFGAIYWAATELHGVNPRRACGHRIVRRLTRRLQTIACEQYPGYFAGSRRSLQGWNDDPLRDFSEVAALLEKAAQ
jgi:hypothetical protein